MVFSERSGPMITDFEQTGTDATTVRDVTFAAVGRIRWADH